MSFRARHWGIALGSAVALQVGAAVLLFPTKSNEPLPNADGGIEISLALAGPMGTGGGGSAANDLQPLALPEVQPLPKPAKPEPKPEPKSEPKKPTPKQPKPKPVANAPASPPAAATRANPDLAEMAVPEAAPPAGMLAGAQAPRSERPGGGDASNRGGHGGPRAKGSTPGGGGSGARQSYYGQLAAALNRHKRYPYAARRARQEGVVKVRFVIDAAGNVLEHDIANSSGHRALDEAVIDLVKRASPLPAIPAELNKTQLAIVLPIEFSLRHP